MKTSWHVATAAEAIAAAQFARLGFDVSVQYGANQPEYDLIVIDGSRMLKLSVKGSKDGGWGLTQTQLAKLKNANYHGAVAAWLARHKPQTVLCFVQFEGVELDAMPRIYLARPREVAERLNASSGGRGDTTLWENITRGPKAAGAGQIERIPEGWRLSDRRVQELLSEQAHPQHEDRFTYTEADADHLQFKHPGETEFHLADGRKTPKETLPARAKRAHPKPAT